MHFLQLTAAIKARAREERVTSCASVFDAVFSLMTIANLDSGPESEAVSRILVGAAGIATVMDYRADDLEALTPDSVRYLDCLLEALADGRCDSRLLYDLLRPGL